MTMLLLLFSFIFAIEVDAHPGRVREDGCHYCIKNCERWGHTSRTRHMMVEYMSCDESKGPIDEEKPFGDELLTQEAFESSQKKEPVKKVMTQKEKKIETPIKKEKVVIKDPECTDQKVTYLLEKSKISVSRVGDLCKGFGAAWIDFYTDKSINHSSEITIDRIISINMALKTGASSWKKSLLEKFINSTENWIILTHQQAKLRRQKGELVHLPVSRKKKCQYINRWEKIKNKWALDIEDEEQDSIDELKSVYCQSGN